MRNKLPKKEAEHPASKAKRGGGTTSAQGGGGPIYLDYNATTPIHPEVEEVLLHYLRHDFGNAGSRTHEFGMRARQAVERARDQVARLVSSEPDEVIFTSGATEANNLALLGLEAFGNRSGRRHIVTTAIEHKAVLEPIELLRTRGFDVSIVAPNQQGWVEPDRIMEALRPDTLALSVMHVNNETGAIQPIDEIATKLDGHPCFFHVDAAQGFGKLVAPLRNRRVDLISASSHKIYGPKGVGALVARRRGFSQAPLTPLMVGGGQERGLRPGTLPVFLIAAFGAASAIAERDASDWYEKTSLVRNQILSAFEPITDCVLGESSRTLPNTISLMLKGIDAEAFFVMAKGHVAVSSGSACTSSSYKTSHVLAAMGLDAERAAMTIRITFGPNLSGDLAQLEKQLKIIVGKYSAQQFGQRLAPTRI